MENTCEIQSVGAKAEKTAERKESCLYSFKQPLSVVLKSLDQDITFYGNLLRLFLVYRTKKERKTNTDK